MLPDRILAALRALGVIFLVLATGCATVNEAPLRTMTQTVPAPDEPAPAHVKQYVVPIVPPQLLHEVTVSLVRRPVVPTRSVIATDTSVAIPSSPELLQEVTVTQVRRPVVPTRSAITPAVSVASEPAVSAPIPARETMTDIPAVAAPTPSNAAPPPVARAEETTLDVAALKTRLRDTEAIGVFTKIALKNQVDDLLKRFREYYLNGQTSAFATLRQLFDMLVLKVLALVQDNDPPLARTIAGSREAIWGILADREKFSSMT